MREKLKSDRGESLVEVLASVLVCALSIALLLGAVTSSTSIDLRAQTADAEYYEILSMAELQAEASSELALSVVVTNADSGATTDQSVPGSSNPPVVCDFYGKEQLFSYALKP